MASSKRAELVAKLKLNSTHFSRGLRAATAKARAFAKSIPTAALKAARTAMFGVAGAATAVAAAMGLGLKKAFDLGGRLSDLSDRTGESAGRLRIMEESFRLAGVPTEELGITLDRLTRRVEIAKEGSGAYAKALKAAGVSAEELSKMSKIERLQAFGEAIEKMGDESKRTQVVMDLLDTGGGRLMSLFDDMEGTTSRAARVVGEQADILDRRANMFDKISDSLGSLKTKASGFFVGFADKVAPALLSVVEKFENLDLAEMGQRFGEKMVQASKAIGTILGDIRDKVAPVIAEAFGKAKEMDLAGKAKEFSEELFEGTRAVISNLEKVPAFLKTGLMLALAAGVNQLRQGMADAMALAVALFSAGTSKAIDMALDKLKNDKLIQGLAGIPLNILLKNTEGTGKSLGELLEADLETARAALDKLSMGDRNREIVSELKDEFSELGRELLVVSSPAAKLAETLGKVSDNLAPLRETLRTLGEGKLAGLPDRELAAMFPVNSRKLEQIKAMLAEMRVPSFEEIMPELRDTPLDAVIKARELQKKRNGGLLKTPFVKGIDDRGGGTDPGRIFAANPLDVFDNERGSIISAHRRFRAAGGKGEAVPREFFDAFAGDGASPIENANRKHSTTDEHRRFNLQTEIRDELVKQTKSLKDAVTVS